MITALFNPHMKSLIQLMDAVTQKNAKVYKIVINL